MVNTFRYSYADLQIQLNEIAELMGFEEFSIPEPFDKIITEAIEESENICIAIGGYKVFDKVKIEPDKGKIIILGEEFLPGKVVLTQLKKAEKVAIMVSTAGNEFCSRIHELEKLGDPLKVYIMDTIGSVIAAKCMKKIEEELIKLCMQNGLSVSDHFSPGYCEWSVAEQQSLFKLLPRGFCGISLSASSLMSPVKSISAFAGIGKGLKKIGMQCNWCTDRNCFYGQINRKKNNKKTE